MKSFTVDARMSKSRMRKIKDGVLLTELEYDDELEISGIL